MIDDNNKPKIIRWDILGCGNVTEIKSGLPIKRPKDFKS